MNALFDSNILIDYLNGIYEAKLEINQYKKLYINPISWIEVILSAKKEHEELTRLFLSQFEQISIDDEVSELAIEIQKEHKIRLPDALIWASAKKYQVLLISRNTTSFSAAEPDIRVPYQLPELPAA